jgi:peptidoglycan-associated lipoprotein
MKRLGLLVVMATLGFSVGCGEKKPAVTPDTVDDGTSSDKGKAADASKAEADDEKKPGSEAPKADSSRDDERNKATATVDDRVAKMCDLPEARFDFDSAIIGGDGRRVLEAIAKCFVSGPGKGKNLNVVGHADPRGEEEYNFALGQRRDGSVAALLKKSGLGEDRVSTTSRGELDATGQDEAGWSRDRRVEILLAP